jgi:hypothetical protein
VVWSAAVQIGDITLVVDREALRCGAWRTVHVTIARGTPKVADLREGAAAHARLRERFPGRTAVLAYAERVGGMPDAETRAYMAKLQKEVAPKTRCAATVVGATGFFASAAYSVLVGLGFFFRPACPTRFFKDLGEAASWVVSHLDDPEATGEGLAEAVQALRQFRAS